mmetsp:Transcript_4661/g.5406  ORF Transcript_4661/g.5406 Transcript_4661/m.5406 type:complete len:127 (+) Transcript_4661:76-456(+)|eukprot:CAMPEP_0198261576 /NCGR_PEP_ID=MMETSP1447-20131203/10273_1 /TAXON_ID=420782 /ORGANISM="Chaetoceros dichaeta, Strain CCMP1751" /LENGTH=126 /DNA_ID=CAMNT_0043949539 /DNA_START=80 /DNA_END=460 /DNA_ORIENTATION=+
MSEQQKTRVRCAHLLIKHTNSRNPISRRTNQQVTLTPQDAMTELQEMKATILQTAAASHDLGRAFSASATQRSDCGSHSRKGDLGFFEKGQMQQPFEEASWALEVGDMTEDVVDTDSGYHLIYRIA